PGSPVINRMAEENPLFTTEYSPERAEPIPKTIRWKADTAASRNAEAIFTTVVLIPFQTEDAVCCIADQIWEANWDSAESTVSTPCFNPEAAEVTTCRIPDQIWEAAFLILFQIFAASEASLEKFPITRSISKSTGARITFFSISHAPAAISQIPDQIPCKVFFAFSHRDVTVVTTSWTIGFCRIAFQVFMKNADTWDHKPLHQSGTAEKKPMKVWNAAGMVSVKKTTTPFHNSISFW